MNLVMFCLFRQNSTFLSLAVDVYEHSLGRSHLNNWLVCFTYCWKCSSKAVEHSQVAYLYVYSVIGTSVWTPPSIVLLLFFWFLLCNSFFRNKPPRFPLHFSVFMSQETSVTRWLDYFSIFGHLQQWKSAQ